MAEAVFLGGAEKIGRTGLVLEDQGARLLVDYGMEAEKPPEFPDPAPPHDLTLLTHAHLDHSGMLPWVASRHGTPVMATAVSAAVANLLHNDSLKIAASEGYTLPYDRSDVETCKAAFQTVRFGEVFHAGAAHQLRVTVHPAGHIPGAVMFQVDGERRGLVTGDLYTRDTRLVKGAAPVGCDYLFMESTYSGREHAPREEVEKAFLDAVDETVRGGGIALVAAFAVGRSQEVMSVLAEAGHEVWLDGMAREVSKIFLRNPGFLRSAKELQRAYDAVKVIHSNHGRRRAREGDVILTTSGMLDGGPILGYLDSFRDDRRSSLFLTGYQVEGTNGRRILESGKVDIAGALLDVHMRVEKFDFSAHAGHSDLVRFAKSTGAEDVYLYHGEGDKRRALAESLADFTNAHLTYRGQVIGL